MIRELWGMAKEKTDIVKHLTKLSADSSQLLCSTHNNPQVNVSEDPDYDINKGWDDLKQYASVIKEVAIEKTNMAALPEDFFVVFCNLRVMKVPRNKLHKMPSAPTPSKSLTHLDIDNNLITNLPDNIFENLGPALKYLNISHNKLEKLPDSVLLCKKLTTLVARDIGLKTIPDGISSLSQMVQLDVGGNTLHSMSPSLATVSNFTIYSTK